MNHILEQNEYGVCLGKRGRGTHKQPVFGIYERNGEVYTEMIENCSSKTLQRIIAGKIDKESTVYSDKWKGYDGLVHVGYDRHIRINHSKEFSQKNGKHINGIENFWSFSKRRLAKFNGVKKYFVLHLKECEWRYKRNPDERMSSLITLLKTYYNLTDVIVCLV